MIKFLVGLLTPIRITSRHYLAQQLDAEGVAKGRLSIACLQELADHSVRMAKLLAPAMRRNWRELVTDQLDGTAVNVSKQLNGQYRLDNSVTDVLHQILAKHDSLPVRPDKQQPLRDEDLQLLRENFVETLEKARALKGRDRIGFAVTIFVASQAYIHKFGDHDGFAAAPVEIQREELRSARQLEQLARSKAKIDPIAGAAALARRAHSHLLAALIVNEPNVINLITANLGPFISEGAEIAANYTSANDLT